MTFELHLKIVEGQGECAPHAAEAKTVPSSVPVLPLHSKCLSAHAALSDFATLPGESCLRTQDLFHRLALSHNYGVRDPREFLLGEVPQQNALASVYRSFPISTVSRVEP
jgi:hypothetical protein